MFDNRLIDTAEIKPDESDNRQGATKEKAPPAGGARNVRSD